LSLHRSMKIFRLLSIAPIFLSPRKAGWS
jgi:hypothetical protein